MADLSWGDPVQPGEMAGISKVAFSPDGLQLAAGDGAGRFAVWQVPPSPAASEMGVADFNQSVRQISTMQLAGVEQMGNEGGDLCQLSFAGGGQELRAAWQERTVRFAVKDGTIIEDAPGLCGLPALEPQDGKILLRLPEAGLSLSAREDYPSREGAVYLADTNILVMIHGGGRGALVQIWKIDGSRLQSLVISHPSPFSRHQVSMSALVVTDQRLSAAWADGAFEQRRLDDGSLLQSASLLSGTRVNALVISPGGGYAAAATADGQVNLWQLTGTSGTEDPRIVRSFPLPGMDRARTAGGSVLSLAFSGDEALLAAATGDWKIYLWQVSDGTLAATLEHPSLPLELQFAAGNGYLAVKSPDGIWVWRVKSLSTNGVEMFPYIFPGYGMGFSPDGNLLAVASHSLGNRKIDIWTVSEFVSSGHGSPIVTIPAVGTFAFSPDGRVIAVSGIDLSVWGVSEGRKLFAGPNPAPYGEIAYSKDGRMMVSVGWEGAYHVWSVP